MGGYITLGGADVQNGRLSLGLRGAGWADVTIATDSPPAVGDRLQLVVDGGLTWTGTVRRVGTFLMNTDVRLVGGAGGLNTEVSGAYQGATLSDVLTAILDAAGESQSSTVAATILAVPLPRWTLGKGTAARALDELAEAAALQLGEAVGWRVLADGTVWVGVETWATQALPDDHVISMQWPDEGRSLLGCAAPSILPGVDLDGVGKVAGVDHYFDPDRQRSETWSVEHLEPIEKLSATVLERLGLNYTGAPRIERLQLARARVDAVASDGSTVDVTPESDRLSPMQKVPLRQTAARAIVKTGSRVLLAWEGGTSGGVVALPVWDDGATFTKVAIDADGMTLNSGTKGGARVDDVLTASSQMAAWALVVETAINALAPGSFIPANQFAGAALTNPGRSGQFGKIASGSTTVKVG